MNKTTLQLFGLFFFTLAPFLSFSQNPNELYHEAPDGAYMPVDKAHRRTSPPYQRLGTNFFMTQVNVDANGNNIVGDAANEPSIATDPNDPERMVIGWRQFDTIASNFRQAGFGYTLDGGLTWTFPGVIDPGIFRSDPVLDSDADGKFYYNSLTVNDNDYLCNVYRSTGNGTWDDGPFAYGGDKQWMIIDKTEGPGKGHIYSNWNESFSVCPPGSFTRSTNGGDSYEACGTISPPIYWGTLSVGPEGDLYTVGNDGQIAKSSNAQNAADSVTWTSFLANLGGGLVGFASNGPNPSGLLGQAWVATDHSGGPNHGNVYVLGSVQPYTVLDPVDVHFIRSTDGGATWSAPVRINDDASINNWQWFGTMSIAPNGRIDVVWLDTRDNPDTLFSSLYYAFSEDGGLSWSANERLSEAFDPYLGWPQQQKMGDYFHMVSDNDGAHLAWAATFNGEQDVYYGHITQEPSAVITNRQAGNALSQNFPNPFSGTTTLPYSLSEAGHVSLKIFHQTGQVARYLIKDEKHGPGKFEAHWDGKDGSGNPMPAGMYFYDLSIDGKSSICRKMVMLR
ncbi:MAG: hypothetical protein KDD27_09200 [Saprospiraceae bacterium]|nr:hypothetical protein [Saprospiraceae bacterium]